MPADLPSPWAEFLAEVDEALTEPGVLHCLGGFVMATHYGLPRPTLDLDYVEILPSDQRSALEALAGPGSTLAERHGLYFQDVTVASLPENYDQRLSSLTARHLTRLRLLILDPYDLALSKLARNHPVDREDVASLARTLHLDASVLRQLRRGTPAHHHR